MQSAAAGGQSAGGPTPLGAEALAALQVMAAGLKEVRDRIISVKNTEKITAAMKLVAAAKVRRAQDAVVNGRPFAENLVKVGGGLDWRAAAHSQQRRASRTAGEGSRSGAGVPPAPAVCRSTPFATCPLTAFLTLF